MCWMGLTLGTLWSAEGLRRRGALQRLSKCFFSTSQHCCKCWAFLWVMVSSRSSESMIHRNSTAPSTAADTRGVNAEMIKHYTRRVKKHSLRLYCKVTKPSEEPPPNWRDGQHHVPERGPVIAIQLPIHLFDPHLIQTLQPAHLPTSTTHTGRQPVF